MPSLYISEYKVASVASGNSLVQAAQEPSSTTQKVTYSTATASSAFTSGVNFIRVVSDADCWLAFGATSTANTLYLPAGTVEYFGVRDGGYVSAYDGSS